MAWLTTQISINNCLSTYPNNDLISNFFMTFFGLKAVTLVRRNDRAIGSRRNFENRTDLEICRSNTKYIFYKPNKKKKKSDCKLSCGANATLTKLDSE